MATFTNNSQMESYFNNILKQIIRNVGNNLLEDFQKHLDETIYKPKEGWYKRYYKNGGFYSGWHIVALDDFCRVLMYDPSRLVEHSQDWVNKFIGHGGDIKEHSRDYRGVLPQVLNELDMNDSYSTFGGAYYPRGGGKYWDEYKKEVYKKIEKWFDEEFKKYKIRKG